MHERTDDALNRPIPAGPPQGGPPLSRRRVLRCTAAVAAGSMVALTAGSAPHTAATATPTQTATATPTQTATARGDVHPRDAIDSILAALDRFPLVALGEYHRIQEMHDFITALLFHPALPGKITDLVVEFGNGFYQPWPIGSSWATSRWPGPTWRRSGARTRTRRLMHRCMTGAQPQFAGSAPFSVKLI